MLAETTDIEILCARVDHNTCAKQDMKNRASHECRLVELLSEKSDIADIAKNYNAIRDRTYSIWSNLQCYDSKKFEVRLDEMYKDDIIAKKFEIKKLLKQRLSLEMSCVLAKSDKDNKLDDILDEINDVNNQLFGYYGITPEISSAIEEYNVKRKEQKKKEEEQEKLMRKQEKEENRRQRELREEEQKEKTDNVVDISKTHIILAQRSKRFTSQR